ncbi:MAG TPA: UDP-glucose/GDP-mannose dehydrogenase family protein [Terriglobales bacterium]|nr:UDP-glucose/GDP-mannose dehydrogenase family protein [Terriglobales bacterium]
MHDPAVLAPAPFHGIAEKDGEILRRIRSRQAKLAVLGMGHVGLPTALSFAAMGWQVLGADASSDLISRIQSSDAPFYEPGLDELLKQQLGRNFFPVDNLEKSIREATVLFLCVGTPQKSNGEANLAQVEAAARTIAQNLNGYKLIVEKSTVPAITAHWIRRTVLRHARNGEHSVDFDVASNPEFLQEGVALKNIFQPERIVCGVDSDRARQILEELYRSVKAPVLVTGLNTAEIIKHAANSFLATKISFINMVSDLCDAIGADITQVAQGIGMDRRIGPHFLQAGIGFGGYCLPKDLRAFIYLAEEHGVDFSLLKQVEVINRQRVEMFVRKVRNALWVLHDKTLAVLGLAFKGGTDDTREAPSLHIVDALLKEGASLRLHDPKAMPLLQRVLPEREGKLTYCESPFSAAAHAHALLILTDWPEYRNFDWAKLRDVMELPLVIDGRNLLDPGPVRRAGFEYISIGRPEA